MRDIFIIGSKGIPAKYGGFETFVDRLTQRFMDNQDFRFHISSMYEVEDAHYHNADVYYVKTLPIGKAKSLIYSILSIEKAIKYVKTNNIENPIFYVLSYGIGPFFGYYSHIIKKLNGKLIVNPDGMEYERRKWGSFTKTYFRFAEKQMIKYADLIICDSRRIEEYINNKYKSTNKTIYISYGSNDTKSSLKDDDKTFITWLNKNNLIVNNYYLMVGRLVPENNHKEIIKEFIKSKTNRDLVIISTINQQYQKQLNTNDKRIKFVGSLYDEELLKKVRENAFAYIHGHEVGGTNPSLLESLFSTKINLLLDVPYNREVGKETTFYWQKNNLNELINKTELLSDEDINKISNKAKQNAIDNYSWDSVYKKYIEVFNKL